MCIRDRPSSGSACPSSRPEGPTGARGSDDRIRAMSTSPAGAEQQNPGSTWGERGPDAHGSGELGKEVAIELQRLGAEVVAVDRYADAPAMQVAHRSHVVDMLDADALRAVLLAEAPHVVVPEIEAIATQVLAEVEATGVRVVPTARATRA